MRKLIIEHINEAKLMVYIRAQSSDGWIHFFIVPRLRFKLQTTLDGEIFLQVYNGNADEFLDLSQEKALFFLEGLLEYEGYYTRDGVARPSNMKEEYCIRRYINMEDKIQEIWDLREKILYCASYGDIGGGLNTVSD